MFRTLVAFSLLLASPSITPRPAPARFATEEHGLTFAVPKGTTYCPLPRDFVGSDHGTILFLLPPKRCAKGAGYPSTARGFTPESTPRIEVYYGYDAAEHAPGDTGDSGCHAIGVGRFLGAAHRLCRQRMGGMVAIKARALYIADAPSEAAITLMTTPGRLLVDLATFKALLASVSVCSSLWHTEDLHGHRTGPDEHVGSGPLCPAEAKYF